MYSNRNKLEKLKIKMLKSTDDKYFFSERKLSYPEREQLKEMVYREVINR